MDAPAVGRAGQVITGRYLLECFLGRGAMGEVWQARHTTLDTRLAIKLVVADGADATTRLLVEAKAAASIVSPFVVRIFDHGQEGKLAFIAMELMVGETLAQRLKQQGRLSPGETATLLRHVAQGIAQAHSLGIVHRDLKPENVFIARTEAGEIAKVLDFGIAKSQMSQGVMTQTGIVVGTPAYLSREQVLGTRDVDLHAWDRLEYAPAPEAMLKRMIGEE